MATLLVCHARIFSTSFFLLCESIKNIVKFFFFFVCYHAKIIIQILWAIKKFLVRHFSWWEDVWRLLSAHLCVIKLLSKQTFWYKRRGTCKVVSPEWLDLIKKYLLFLLFWALFFEQVKWVIINWKVNSRNLQSINGDYLIFF